MQVARARDLQALGGVALTARAGGVLLLVAPDLEALHETLDRGGQSVHGVTSGKAAWVGGRVAGWHFHGALRGSDVPNRSSSGSAMWNRASSGS